MIMKSIIILTLFCVHYNLPAQNPPVAWDQSIAAYPSQVSRARIESDIRTLAAFGTRHTLSDTISSTRGIGAARRWIYDQFKKISRDCNNCLDVYYQYNLVPGGEYPRIPEDTWVVNVIAVLRGTEFPDRYIIMAGDIDSRISDPLDGIHDSPGANDNASGMAGVIEAARVLSKDKFANSIMFAGLSGEEQGLVGGKYLAEKAKNEGWEIMGVLNNDMIGNTEGITGIKDNRSFRIFSEPVPVNLNEQQKIWHRFYGGEVDGPSRQLARYIYTVTKKYLPELEPTLIYRLDRFGRGGHHRPFNDAGFPGVRIMETHEHYDRQHQDIRNEDGRQYGDLIEYVDFNYAAKLTAVNIISLASIAHSPLPPQQVMIGGAVSPSTQLKWTVTSSKNLAGFKVYWRDTTSPVWQYEKWVGNVSETTLENIIIDNYLFGVASVSTTGHESIIQYPLTLIPRTAAQN